MNTVFSYFVTYALTYELSGQPACCWGRQNIVMVVG